VKHGGGRVQNREVLSSPVTNYEPKGPGKPQTAVVVTTTAVVTITITITITTPVHRSTTTTV
jgi:hypothetical protein